MAGFVSAEFPGERLLVCLNPRLRQERAQNREQLLCATETILTKIVAATRHHKSNSANRDRTIKRLGREANCRKVEKHFDITVTNGGPAVVAKSAANPQRSSTRRSLCDPNLAAG